MSAKDEADSATNAEMAALRARIDALDASLVDTLAERVRCIEAAAEIKIRIGWPARIPPRVDEVIARVAAHAGDKNLDPEFVRSIWSAIVEWSIAYEESLMAKASDRKVDPA